ncbi:MAG TPA: hypothetical protein PKE47_14260 [Verrucomicrobiota bacterium]|nr:hypothetical protein [Verrucomicrobiota bacterium]
MTSSGNVTGPAEGGVASQASSGEEDDEDDDEDERWMRLVSVSVKPVS